MPNIYTVADIVALLGLLFAALSLIWNNATAKRLASFQDQAQKDIERLKADLRKSAFEHDTRFTYLHQRRVEKIEELNKLLANTQRILTEYIQRGSPNAGQDYGKEQKDIREALRKLSHFLDDNSIYFDDELTKSVAHLTMEIQTVQMGDIQLSVNLPEEAGPGAKTRAEIWDRSLEVVTERIPKIRGEIREQMQEILGAKQV